MEHNDAELDRQIERQRSKVGQLDDELRRAKQSLEALLGEKIARSTGIRIGAVVRDSRGRDYRASRIGPHGSIYGNPRTKAGWGIREFWVGYSSSLTVVAEPAPATSATPEGK